MQNRWIVAVLLVGLSTLAPVRADAQTASDRAVSGVNGELGLSGGEARIKGGDEQSVRTIYAAGNVPLGRAFGLNVGASQSHVEYSGSFDLDYDAKAYSISAFWRNPQAGLLSFGRGRSEVSDIDAKWDTQTIVGAAYSEVAALSVMSQKAEATSDTAISGDFLQYHIVAYPSPDFLIDLTIGAQDADNSYSLAFEQQFTSVPSLSFELAYSVFRDDPEVTAWFLRLNFRLGDRKPLVRRYHEDLFGVR